MSPFVGRNRELEALRRALGQADAGRGQVVAAVGEPGVGKTRLFYEFARSPGTQGWLVLDTASVSYGKATPYLPIIGLLKAYFGIDDGDDVRTIRARVADKLATLDPAPPPRAAFLALLDASLDDDQWQILDPPQRRQRTLDAVKRLVLRESQVRPVCLVVENLHWIDQETQALLDTLVESLPVARLLLLVNYRPEYQHGWGSTTHYTELRIDPLPRESAEVLLQAILGAGADLHPLRQLLITQTEGNPFFMEESVQALVEIRVLIGERGAYRLTKAMPTVRVPATVQAVLAARIDRLLPEDKQLLQLAAVIGKNVPFALLAAVAEETEDALRRRLAKLKMGEFIYELKLLPEPEYTFKHALTQEVAYGSLLQPTRQHHHRRIAHALGERFPESVESQPELIAYHYTQAGLNDHAMPYWQRAGVRASQQGAYAAAAAHLGKALEMLASQPDTRERRQRELDLQTALGPALMATKGYAAPELAAAYGRAKALCQELGETLPLHPVLWGLWAFISYGRSWRRPGV